MAQWSIKCQTCSKAITYSCCGGVCFPCTDSECNYKPYITTATTMATPYRDYAYTTNKTENKEICKNENI